MFFGLLLLMEIITIFVLYKIIKDIQNKKYKFLVKIMCCMIAILIAFFSSMDGWKGNTYFQFFIIEFILGIVAFIYGIFRIIKNRRMSLLIFSPILLIASCFSGMYFGRRNERKIFEISKRVKEYYIQNGNYDDRERFFEYIKTPKNMSIIITEKNEIVIKYKKIIYYVTKSIMNYEITE